MFDFKILFVIIFIIISDDNVNQVFSQIHVRVAYLFFYCVPGHEDQEVGVNEEKPAVDMDADRIEDDEEEDVEGWDSDEFDLSENDSDDREETLPNKRQSRIIFGELLDIPDLVSLHALGVIPFYFMSFYCISF